MDERLLAPDGISAEDWVATTRDDPPIGLGCVVAGAQRSIKALEPLDTAIHVAVQTTAAVSMDKTNWRDASRRCWLWTGVTAQAIGFRITTSRGRTRLDALFTPTFGGIINSDRWDASKHYPDPQQQLCRAYLNRTVRSAEHSMRDNPSANDLLVQITALFSAWQLFHAGRTNRVGLHWVLQSIPLAIRNALKDRRRQTWYKVVGLSQEVLTWRDALWTFITSPGVEPTNNAAKRALHPTVIWRTQCFSAQSADDNRFVERILFVVTTCRQQGRRVWDLLTEAVQDAVTGRLAPTLPPAM